MADESFKQAAAEEPGQLIGPGERRIDEQIRLSRRRALLRGLGSGSVVISAAMPIKSMAYTAALTGTGGKICSLSGVQSGAHSRTTITAICGGRNVTFYSNNLPNWPNYTTSPAKSTFSNGTMSFTDGAKFNQVFGAGSSSNSVFTIVKNDPTSDEAHWIVALLNANVTRPGFVAPYSPGEVVALYADPAKSTAALAFFKSYMETLTS